MEQHNAGWFIGWILKAPFIAFYIGVATLFGLAYLSCAYRTLWRIGTFAGMVKTGPPRAESNHGQSRTDAVLMGVALISTMMAGAFLSDAQMRTTRPFAVLLLGVIAAIGVLVLVDLWWPPR